MYRNPLGRQVMFLATLVVAFLSHGTQAQQVAAAQEVPNNFAMHPPPLPEDLSSDCLLTPVMFPFSSIIDIDPFPGRLQSSPNSSQQPFPSFATNTHDVFSLSLDETLLEHPIQIRDRKIIVSEKHLYFFIDTPYT